MGQETIDIVVKESGAATAARDILNIGTAADTSDAQIEKLNASIAGLATSVDKNTTAVTAASQAADKQATEEEKAAAAVKQHAAAMESGAAAAEQLRGVLVSLGLALGISEWMKLTDAYQQNVNQLKQVAQSTEEFHALQERLHQISGETFSDLSTNTRLFVSMTKASRDLQVSHADLLNVVHVLNDALRLGGASSDEAQAAMQALSTALQRGSISARQILPLLHEMPDLMAALADKFGFTGNRTAAFVEALTKGEVPVQALLQGIANLDNSLVAGSRAVDAHSTSLNKNFQALQIVRVGMDNFGASANNAHARVMTVSQSVLNMGDDTDKASQKLKTATGNVNELAQKFQAVTPTIRDAWKNVTTALEEYIGTQDRLSGGSGAVATALQTMATNGHTFFGVLITLGSALTAYTLAVNASRIATLLFASTFSPFATVVTLIIAASAAMMAFGNDVKLTADGSVTALGALYGIVNSLKEGLTLLWNAVGQGVGPWGQVLVAVTAFTTATRILIGIDLLAWFGSVITALGSMALATYAAIGPWGLLATAIITAGLALAYYTGQLDTAIAVVKSQMGPAIDYLTEKMRTATSTLTETAIATKDFGKDTEATAAQVMQSYSSMGSGIANTTAQINSSLKSGEAGFQDWAGEVTSEMSKVTAAANSTAASLKSLSSSSGRMSSDFVSDFTGDFFSDNAGGNHRGGILWNNSGTLSSSDLTHSHFATGGAFMVGGQGGTDSQLVQFMASPNERVTVETPDQQRRTQGSGSVAAHVNMTVIAKDATSFHENKQQTAMALQSELTRALRRMQAG